MAQVSFIPWQISYINLYKQESMRYEYTVTDGTGKEEKVQNMSWKKMLKSLLLKTPKFTGKIAYINKKKHKLIRFIKDGRIVWNI